MKYQVGQRIYCKLQNFTGIGIIVTAGIDDLGDPYYRIHYENFRVIDPMSGNLLYLYENEINLVQEPNDIIKEIL